MLSCWKTGSSGKLHFSALYWTVVFGKWCNGATEITASVNAIVSVKPSSCSNEHKLWAMLIKSKVTKWILRGVPGLDPRLPILIFLLCTCSFSLPHTLHFLGSLWDLLPTCLKLFGGILPFFSFSCRFLSKPFSSSFPSLLLSVTLLPTFLFYQSSPMCLPSKEVRYTIY